jgi:DNA-binding MarR family transcriptional regulator
MRLNFKRLGLLGGKAARECAKLAGLTSARVDLMVLLRRYDRSQVELATILCVSPSVVSRMVTALEELGLVWRHVPDWDLRIRFIRLTDAGLAQLHLCFGDAPKLPHDGTRSAQCVGEAAWLLDWKAPLAKRKARIGSLVRSAAPPFWEFRERNRQNPYAAYFRPPRDEVPFDCAPAVRYHP